MIIGNGVVVHLVVWPLWKWGGKDWQEGGLVRHRVNRLRTRVGNLDDRKVFIKVVDWFRMRMEDRMFRMRMEDRMFRQVMRWLSWVVGGWRRVSLLIVFLWWVMFLWQMMRRRMRSNSWFVRDPRSETGVVLKKQIEEKLVEEP